jgi:hypothetical protein
MSIRHIAAAGALALGVSLAGLGGIGASAAGTQGNDLGADIQTGIQSGQSASAHDADTAAEFNLDEGQIEDVDSEEDQSDTQPAETEVTSSSTSEHSGAADAVEPAETEVTSSSTSEHSSAADAAEPAEAQVTSSSTSEQSHAANAEHGQKGSADGESDAGNTGR